MIKAIFKFDKNIPRDAVVIDTTSNSGNFRELSPFVLPAPPARNFENLWQFSKVYPQHVDKENEPNDTWWDWMRRGFVDGVAHRYPMGKGAIPLYSYWQGKHLGYIEARKQIYAPEYARNVASTDSFKRLQSLYAACCSENKELILLDYDAYDHIALGKSLQWVINNPNRKMGHAFILIMMLLPPLLEEYILAIPKEEGR